MDDPTELIVNQTLKTLLHRRRGDNRKLIQEVIEKLSVGAKLQLHLVFADMEMDTSIERSKRQRGDRS